MSLSARVAVATYLICGLNAGASSAQGVPPGGNPTGNSSAHWLTDPQTGCRASVPDFGQGDGIAWSGACIGGVVGGPGTLTILTKGQPQVTVSGSFRNGELENGQASLVWPDGSRYDGEQSSGKFNGKGVFVSAQRDRLDGEWKDGALNGHAVVTWANGNRYEGVWSNGKANGQGVETWANGDRYDGEWSDDRPNGNGKLVRAEGTTYVGKFVDGHPQSAAMADAHAAPAVDASASVVPRTLPAGSVLPAAAIVEQQHSPSRAPLGDVEGKKLFAVDGSSIALSQSEDGFTRAITKPDGGGATLNFTFVNDRMGTVADTADSARVTGLFKMTDTEIDVDYSDGHSEILRPGAGGITLLMHTPEGQNMCMAWYPEGHAFSEAEKRAALAEYASKLGVSLKSIDTKGGTHTSACSLPLATAAVAKPPTLHARNVPRPQPRPIQASFELPATAGTVSPQAIIVRDSRVHSIDAPMPVHLVSAGGQSPGTATVPTAEQPATPTLPTVMSPAPPVTSPMTSVASALPASQPALSGAYQPDSSDPGASSCLVVASDGTHWGFRNSCRYSVQFVYCLKGETEQLASCKNGAISGSASPDSFSALVADASMKEKGVDHQFRWVACSGGAGEVIPKLDGIDPPMGRCLRARTAFEVMFYREVLSGRDVAARYNSAPRIRA